MRDRITYEILENGYKINLDGQPWIEQIEPHIPYPNLSYEEGCLKQIEEIVSSYEQSQNQPTIEEQITDIELAIAELYELQQGGTN